VDEFSSITADGARAQQSAFQLCQRLGRIEWRLARLRNRSRWKRRFSADETYQDGRIAEVAIEKAARIQRRPDDHLSRGGILPAAPPFNCPKAYDDLYDPAMLPEPFPLAKPAGAETSTTNQSGELSNYGHGTFYPGDPARTPTTRIAASCGARISRPWSYVDAQIGKVLDALEALGPRAEHDWWLLWGDHGWQLDDYDLLGKHTCLERSLHAPLIIRAPEMSFRGVPAAGLVESIDIYRLSSSFAVWPGPQASMAPAWCRC
jgi:hypothetical protein